MSKVRMAIIGAGGIAGSHVSGLRILKEANLDVIDVVAIADIVEENAKRRANEIASFQAFKPKVYTDYKRMLSEEKELEAVDICVDHRSHHIVAVDALNAGKHTIVEKPLGITIKAAKQMIEASRKNGKILATAENYRRSIEDRVIKWAVEKGMIGTPRMLYWLQTNFSLSAWGWRNDKMKAGGGWIFDGGVHFADLFLYILGEIEEVYAITKTLEPIRYDDWPEMNKKVKSTVEDLSFALLKFKNGVTGAWIWSNVSPGENFNHRIINGTSGSISWENGLTKLGEENLGKYTLSLYELAQMMKKELGAEKVNELFPNGIGTRNLFDFDGTIAIELYDFARSIIEHKKPEVDGELGLKAEAIPLAIFESSVTGEPVKVEDVINGNIEVYQKEINESLGL
ncbi:MAG: Gfo/Idh/MocA family oxidoreductase [Thermoproteota archaeon]|nr:Gfo/Idh/MocA family oxidoreductase [Candidatus Brockarchaeota archaeon]MBO3801083.1 Gfo/Idh/MocA family oxidoreductase [Candidatus Brockarchaeota archaeon]